MADILADMGYLFLGSRLKRLAERLQADAARLLKTSDLPIQPAQFPLLAAIDRYGPLTIGDAVEALGVSQPAVTRTASSLLDIGLLAASRDDADMRQKTLALTDAGKALMARARAVLWPPLGTVVTTLPIGPEHPGVYAGPGFELFYQVDYLLPHKAAAWVLMEERLRDAAAFARRCGMLCVPTLVKPLGDAARSLERFADQLRAAA